jgi:hypothetical protein
MRKTNVPVHLSWTDADLNSYRANEHTQAQNKKTIMPQDVLDALDDVEFPGFREQLEEEFKSRLSPLALPSTALVVSLSLIPTQSAT